MQINRIKLIALMAQKRMTCEELAQKANVSRNTVSKLRAGYRCQNVVGVAIARGLGVDITELLDE